MSKSPSLVDKLKDAKEDNKGDIRQFAKESSSAIYANWFCRIFLFLITHVVSIILLAISIVYFDDCPTEPRIPIILIVYSSFSLTSGTLLLIASFCFSEYDSENSSKMMLQCIAIICSFGAFISFIIACVWIYGHAFPDYNSASSDYCHQVLYVTAFVFVTLVLVLISLLILLICCLCCIVLFGK